MVGMGAWDIPGLAAICSQASGSVPTGLWSPGREGFWEYHSLHRCMDSLAALSNILGLCLGVCLGAPPCQGSSGCNPGALGISPLTADGSLLFPQPPVSWCPSQLVWGSPWGAPQARLPCSPSHSQGLWVLNAVRPGALCRQVGVQGAQRGAGIGSLVLRVGLLQEVRRLSHLCVIITCVAHLPWPHPCSASAPFYRGKLSLRKSLGICNATFQVFHSAVIRSSNPLLVPHSPLEGATIQMLCSGQMLSVPPHSTGWILPSLL